MSPLKDLFHALQSHDSARATLPRVKTTLLKHDLLVPNASSSVSDVVLARDILELAALVSVRAHDGTAFERYLAQLGSFWELDLYAHTTLVPLTVAASLHRLIAPRLSVFSSCTCSHATRSVASTLSSRLWRLQAQRCCKIGSCNTRLSWSGI